MNATVFDYGMARARWLAYRRTGLRQREIAERLGCSQSMVAQLIAGTARSVALEQAFASLVGEPVGVLFPPHPGSRVAAGTGHAGRSE